VKGEHFDVPDAAGRLVQPCYKWDRATIKVKKNQMVEDVLNPRNIMRAFHKVKSSNGSAGVDGIPVKELYAYLTKNRGQIESDIRKGKYLPQPIRGVELSQGRSHDHRE
jgi:hypothetical protein